MSFFDYAANLMRDEAAASGKMSPEWMAKWKASHKPLQEVETTRAEADAQELASFDRAEANAINGAGT